MLVKKTPKPLRFTHPTSAASMSDGWKVVARAGLCQMIKKEGSEKEKGGDKKEKSTGGHKQRRKRDTWIQSPGFSP